MPRLRQISCQLEWPETGLAFSEYGTVYGDGLVETFIAVPDKPQHFSIHLTSKGYIAEGLAMLVYIDGGYQCNRNRLHLKPPKKGQPRDQTDVDIKLRQKEKTIGGGTFIGRDWRFDCHNIVPNEQFPGGFDRTHFDQLGTIEVIVLRCRARSDDDNGSESLTHESILGEIDDFGRTPEGASALDEADGNQHASIAEAPEGAEELPAQASQARSFGSDGAADDEPHHFGLDGAAPPHGYWTYHSQPPPPNDYRAVSHPERRVHFDYGSPKPSYYPTRGTSYPHRGQIRGGDRVAPTGHAQSDWHGRGPAEYGGGGSLSTWPGTTQQAPAFPEKGGAGWGWGMPNEAPQDYSEPVPNEYSDYDDPQPYVPPQKPPAPHHPVWMAPGYGPATHSGWNPAPSSNYPVFTPQPRFGPGSGYPGAPAGYQPFYPPLNGFQGPGYTMNYPIPAGGWPVNKDGGRSGSLDPAREENNPANDAGKQAQNNTWGNNDGNNNNSSNTEAAANNTTAGGGDQGGNTGDANKTDNGGDTGEPNDGGKNNSGDQQSENNANASGWGDNNAQDSATQGDGDGNKTQNSQTQASWNNNDNAQSTQTQGNWDNNNAPQNNQTQGNWDNTANNATASQPQQTQNQWNNYDTSAGTGTFQPTSHRSTRPLYGPHGAYYYSSNAPRPNSTANNDGFSPTAEAEEEPPFDVPESVAAETGTSHQVQAGKGYLYVHKRASPEYIDGIEEPYARFVFKYRTKEQIEREIGVKIECEPTGDEEKRKFTDKTQDELIELLLRAQSALGGKIPSPPPLPAGDGDERDGTKQDIPAPVPVPAPTVYKYLKYELPKGRGPGLGISGGGGGGGGGSNASQAQAQQGAGGGWQNLSSSGPAGGWGQPSGQQPQQEPQQQQQGGAPNWQNAAQNGNQKPNQNQNQSQGGGNGNGQNADGGGASKRSSPGDAGGWGQGPATASNAAGPALQEAPAPAGGAW